jgi:hypothetical protein
MTTIGHVFIPLNREHDGTVPTDDDQAHFESLPFPLALWEPFEQCLSKHLSELTEGQVRSRTRQRNDCRGGGGGSHRRVGPAQLIISLAAFARRAVDRHVGVVFVIS